MSRSIGINGDYFMLNIGLCVCRLKRKKENGTYC